MALQQARLDEYVAETDALLATEFKYGGIQRLVVPASPKPITFARYTEGIVERGDCRFRVVYDTAKKLSVTEIDHEYRFEISRRDHVTFEPVIRFETDRSFPPHAHFWPGYMEEAAAHFTEDLWPPELRGLTFVKAWNFFDTFRKTKRLPPPFGKSTR
jgi:hypothetical protein